jgi:hypothetical protein
VAQTTSDMINLNHKDKAISKTLRNITMDIQSMMGNKSLLLFLLIDKSWKGHGGYTFKLQVAN